jgi:hypothetical protein
MWRVGPILVICALLIGCGGRGLVGSGSNSPASDPVTTSSTNPAPVPAPPSSTGSPTTISLAPGQNVTAANITVTPLVSATPPNAQDLGVNPVSGLGMAVNTGGAIHRGSTMRILLFGPGLTGDMKVSIAGPQDINVGALQPVQATDNTPGVAFVATVAGNAAPGARTVYLKAANGDVTSFTGGLEVIP